MKPAACALCTLLTLIGTAGGRPTLADPLPPEQITYEPAELILSFAVKDDRVQEELQAFRRGYGRDLWPGKAEVSQSTDSINLGVDLKIPDKDQPGRASYQIALTRDGDQLVGVFTGKCRGRSAKGKAEGRFLTITPETPRDWNLIG